MIKTELLTTLFTRYGYEQREEKPEHYVVFSSGTSMYPAVEIVRLDKAEEHELNTIKREYSEAGYAVRICTETSFEQIEHYLFNWFFQVRESNARIADKYKEYTDSVMQAYVYQGANSVNAEYEYINIPYSLEYNFNDIGDYDNGLIDKIRNDLRKEGPQLVIVEAGAGFGKTSTAYEILKDYASVIENVRPFFMELSKDRIAPTFHYLLNSQIDKNFKVRLGSDIVIYNIKRGYIPLIIDGFDELLSKDLDNGEMTTSFKQVETMLSTIADLLTDQAKVILTTRKTAIFAGENFYEWYNKHCSGERRFGVSRYQLIPPSICNWLPKSKLQKLPHNFEKISNPVLLGYLRYLNDEDYDDAVKSSSLTSHYLNAILRREKDRQDLPLKVDEQIVVLRRLAAYFAGFDSTAFPRTEVKDAIRETSYELIQSYVTLQKDMKSLTNTLTNHAFLDRKGDTNIGFLNDFILGVFMMYAVIDEEEVFFDDFIKNASYSILEKSIISGSVFDREKKIQFKEQLTKRCSMNSILTFWADTLLLEKTSHNYSKISLDGRSLTGVILGSHDANIEKCSFSNMKFVDCVFDFNYITECSFINCKFQGCSKEGTNTCCGFYGCTDVDGSNFIDEYDSEKDIASHQEEKDYLLEFLKMYFRVDMRTTRMRMISRLRESFPPEVFKRVFSLAEANKYINTNGDKSFINKAGIAYYNENRS